MVAPFVLAGSYGGILSEVDKPILHDVFHSDDLLDFSNEDIARPIVAQLLGLTADRSVVAAAAEPRICCSSSLLEEANAEQTSTMTLEVINDKMDLCVPCDDLADLDWLSSFVENSFTMGDAPELLSTCGFSAMTTDGEPELATVPTPTTKVDPYQEWSPVSVLENSATSSELNAGSADYYRDDVSVPGRARSKRSRTGARTWTSCILPSSSSVSSFESIATDSYAVSFPPLRSHSGDSALDGGEHDGDDDSHSSKRCKLSKNSNNHNNNNNHNNHSNNHSNNSKAKKKNQDITQPWRCLHCQTQRTPQWRMGPMGPKTLCNACGVRFKSGRLFPEYRPAGSPTYLPHKHSHSHKKVLEMRHERELRIQQQPSPQQQQQHQQT